MNYEIDLLLSRRFLSQAGEGANSWFYYAQRLCDFPQGIFSLALATATLPSLAKLVARGDREEVANTAAHAFRLALYVGLPATALLVALARPIITAVFARGAFDQASIDGTSIALMVQGLGVVVVAMVRQLVPLYYALGDTRTPVVISGLDLVAFVAIALSLRGPLGHVGVSAAVTGSSIVQLALLMMFLRQRLPELRWSMIGKSVFTAGAASIVAGALGFGAAWLARPAMTLRGVGGMIPALAGAMVFGVAYLALCRALGNEEQAEIVSGVRRRLRRR
jgi:putative peptidoglycan lipid II flippase